MMEDKENFPYPMKPSILKERCVCSWNDFRSTKQEFTDSFCSAQEEGSIVPKKQKKNGGKTELGEE